MLIHVEQPMLVAATDCVQEYQPIFRDQPLKAESGIPANSEANLKLLLKAGLEVIAIHVVNDRPLFIFDTGASYLATGFQLSADYRDPKCVAFARMVARVFGGKEEEWVPAIADHWPPAYTGPIVAADRPSGLKPKVFNGE